MHSSATEAMPTYLLFLSAAERERLRQQQYRLAGNMRGVPVVIELTPVAHGDFGNLLIIRDSLYAPAVIQAVVRQWLAPGEEHTLQQVIGAGTIGATRPARLLVAQN